MHTPQNKAKWSSYRCEPPPGRCIYCGSLGATLTDEHIVPQGLGGRHFIPNASCPECQRITQRFENDVLRGEHIWPMRSFLGMRGKKRKPVSEMNMSMVSHMGRRSRPSAHVEKIPVKAVLPYWGKGPSMLTGGNPEIEGSKQVKLFQIVDRQAEKWAAYHFGPGAQRIQINLQPFAQMLCKISHCSAVASFGIDNINPFLVDLILGSSRKWEFFVGDVPYSQAEGILRNIQNFDDENIVRIVTYADHFFLVKTFLQIFSIPGSPVYQIITGRLMKHPYASLGP